MKIFLLNFATSIFFYFLDFLNSNLSINLFLFFFKLSFRRAKPNEKKSNRARRGRFYFRPSQARMNERVQSTSQETMK
jgi:hypothetical protein